MNTSLSEYYQRKAAEQDERSLTYLSPNPYKRWFFRTRSSAVVKVLDPKYDCRVLDLGCGPGWYRHLCESVGADWWGVDIAAKELYRHELEQHRHGLLDSKVANSDVVTYMKRRGDRSAQRILCSEVIEHVEDPIGLLIECRRVVTDNGFLVLTTPNTKSYMEKAYNRKRKNFEFNEHISEFSEPLLREILDRCGFVVESVTYCNFLVPYPLDKLAMKLGKRGVAFLNLIEKTLQRIPILKKKGWTMIFKCRPK